MTPLIFICHIGDHIYKLKGSNFHDLPFSSSIGNLVAFIKSCIYDIIITASCLCMFKWENKQIWHLWLNLHLYLNVLSASRSYPLKYRNAQWNVLSMDIWVKWLMIIILLNDSYLGVAFFKIWDNLGNIRTSEFFTIGSWVRRDKLFSNPAPNTVWPVTASNIEPFRWASKSGVDCEAV